MTVFHDRKDQANKIKRNYIYIYILHHCRPKLDLASAAAANSGSIAARSQIRNKREKEQRLKTCLTNCINESGRASSGKRLAIKQETTKRLRAITGGWRSFLAPPALPRAPGEKS